MKLNDYQDRTWRTAKYPHAGESDIISLTYVSLGLGGESGEVQEKVKKALRDDNGVVTDATRVGIAKELGDVLWYVARVAAEIDITLEDVAKMNLNKLADRLERGVIGGSGDDR